MQPDFLRQSIDHGRTFYREEPGQTALAVVCGGREHCAVDFRVERAGFPYLGLEWVASGRGTLWLAGRRHPLHAGSLFLYGPGIPHRITTDPADRMVKYFVDCQGAGARQLLRRHGFAIPSFRQVGREAPIMAIFDLLVEVGTGSSPMAAPLLARLFEALLVAASGSEPALTPREGRARETFLRCRAHLEKNLRSLTNMEQAARECHLDPAYLSRLFRRFAGESPHRFLARLKMNAAAVQLMRRNALVKEVAAEFGYADPYHFSKAFKKVHGVAPEIFARRRAPGTPPD